MISGYNSDYYELMNELEDILEDLPSEMLGAVFAVLIVALIIALGLLVLIYLFTSIGLYRMGKNRGMTNAYLAFIPFASVYYLGALSDQINAANGKQTTHRVKILTFYLVYLGCSFIGGMFQGVAMAMGSMGLVALTSLFSLATAAFSIVYIVFYYIALYTIFKEYSPKCAVAFLVLSIFFSITTPFFIFALRNKVGTSQQPKYYYPQPPVYPNPYQ